MPAPRQTGGRWREGTSVSFGVHAVLFAVLFFTAARVPGVITTAVDAGGPLEYFVARPGPARGGGGGGDHLPAAPRPAEIAPSKPSSPLSSSALTLPLLWQSK
jgi:hypothetical protein